MKALKIMLAAVAFAAIACLPAAAQFRIGPRIGTEVNSMRLNSGAGEEVGAYDFAYHGKAEFVLEVDGNLDIVALAEAGRVKSVLVVGRKARGCLLSTVAHTKRLKRL